MNTQDFAALICNELRNGVLPGSIPSATFKIIQCSLRRVMDVARLCAAVAEDDRQRMAMFCQCLHIKHAGQKCSSCGCNRPQPFDIDGDTNIRGNVGRKVLSK